MKSGKVIDTVTPNLAQKQDGFQGRVMEAFGNIAEFIIQEARGLAYLRLQRPGGYLECFDWQLLGGYEMRIGNTHRMGKLIELGSKPHPIYPSGQALRFFKEGEWKFRPRVSHPGTKPLYIIRDAFRVSDQFIRQQLREVRG